MNIGPYSLEDYMHLVKSFHGSVAPGLIVGGFMVEAAKGELPPGILYDAITETVVCLPDAVQLLTPCTVGNGWLRVLDLGRFALCLYDKTTGRGVRVFVDPGKLDGRPAVRDWFLRLKAKRDQDPVRLRDEIIAAGTDILGVRPVVVARSFIAGGRKKGPITLCPACGEAYPAADGPRCLACDGNYGDIIICDLVRKRE
ncbi:MAG TPA: formylmethanofuran dehydrogenase subunit E family protein [Syntrophales bacterium]|nr:formylmethanofuran dehydrogenase subunit E family protein [Syntrophales bacterium]HOM07786.1 formylmethanofuran dehydrogenase subunit E family protein [Syntrophales bacterium]HOO00492.1 formylmethanofuran dehydrogenase subunit E family protein [Syntrophales bacterium]HPC01797.1 formylmethanofuran dehydrogenase subunit E family protein [Syntrophales bacterium]HPQ07278.1 formylmethanofuran dehydrogenase subunit E family protein [Syntrophales bacterium]